MRVVAKVGLDEKEIRKRAGLDVRLKRGEWDDAPLAARSVQPDWIEINERIMFLNIVGLIPQKARPWHVLLVGFPGAPAGFDIVGQTRRVDETIIAIDINTKGITTNESNVIRQTRMGNCVILRQQRIFAPKLIVIRHQRIADHASKLFVLEHYDDNMLEIWNNGLLRGSCSWRWGGSGR